MEKGEYAKTYQLEEKNWWYVSRRALVFGLFGKYNTANNPSIIDLGCGTGKTMEEFQKTGTGCIGVDSSSEAIAFCKKRGIKALKKEVEEIDFTNEFDVVLALDLLEHVERDEYLVKRVFRALRDGGIFIVSVPAFGFLWSPHDVLCHHKRRYNRGEIIRVLESAGFCIEFSSYWNFSFFLPSALLKIIKRCFAPKNAESDLFKIKGSINLVLKSILSIENKFVLSGVPMPFGTSVFCVSRKPFK